MRYSKDVQFRKIGVMWLIYCLIGKKEYRSVFEKRLACNSYIRKLIMLFLPRLDTIEVLTQDIGSGMRLFHKAGCTINAEKIGANFSCGHNTTIGIGKASAVLGINRPVLGDNV